MTPFYNTVHNANPQFVTGFLFIFEIRVPIAEGKERIDFYKLSIVFYICMAFIIYFLPRQRWYENS